MSDHEMYLWWAMILIGVVFVLSVGYIVVLSTRSQKMHMLRIENARQYTDHDNIGNLPPEMREQMGQKHHSEYRDY